MLAKAAAGLKRKIMVKFRNMLSLIKPHQCALKPAFESIAIPTKCKRANLSTCSLFHI